MHETKFGIAIQGLIECFPSELAKQQDAYLIGYLDLLVTFLGAEAQELGKFHIQHCFRSVNALPSDEANKDKYCVISVWEFHADLHLRTCMFSGRAGRFLVKATEI